MELQKMTKKEFFKKAYYLTQYDRCFMSDDSVLNYLYDQLKDIDESSLSMLLSFIEKTSDDINQILFDHYKSITQDTINDIIDLYEAIDKKDIYTIEKLTERELYEVYSYDSIYYDLDDLIDMIDNSLRDQGIDSPYISTYANLDMADLQNAEFIKIDIYDKAEAISFYDVLDEYIGCGFIEEFFKNLM